MGSLGFWLPLNVFCSLSLFFTVTFPVILSEINKSLPFFSSRDAKIAASERVKSGVTGEQLWLQINEPTEKDKGKYTMDIFDGKDGVKRVFDLSGQGGWSFSSFFFLKSPISSWVFFPSRIGVKRIIIGVFILQRGRRHLKNSRDSSK